VDAGSDGMLTVQVIDDGTGIPDGGRRSGLRNLAARAEKLGGELRLSAADPAAGPSAAGPYTRKPSARPGLGQLVPDSRVRDLGDDLLGLRRGVMPAWTRTGSVWCHYGC
jgi:hypothetical protein